MAQPSKFWDRIADRYARKPVPDEKVYQRKLETTREYFRPDMEVLELGCGTGSTAIAHAPYVKHIRAVDISARMLAIGADRAAAAGVTNVTFEQADVDDFAAPGDSFDVVLALSVLHLLEDKDAAMAKVRTMLKPGGVFVSSTACVGDTMKWFKLVGPVGHFLGLIPMVKVFTRQALLDSLTRTGFTIEHEWQPGKGKAVFVVARKAA